MEKKETTYPKATLCDTTYIPDYEEYKENCEANELEPQGDGSGDFWDFVSESRSIEYDTFILNMQNSAQAQQPCLLTGSCGLWDGTHEIIPYKFRNVISAIVKAYKSCDDLIVNQEDGVIKVESFHHDGRNRFEIRPLTEHGKQALENDCDGEPISCQLTDDMVGKYEGYLY